MASRPITESAIEGRCLAMTARTTMDSAARISSRPSTVCRTRSAPLEKACPTPFPAGTVTYRLTPMPSPYWITSMIVAAR